ncbi:MAG TPA: peptide deformylase [Candidatus Acidoferrum sp.]|nr:peptide deformylase [Candidatus Acidoferrum sp.]
MRLQIVQIGEEVLRAPANQLSREEILSAKIQELIEHMRDTMRNAPGVGLAAPQVGVPLQLAVIEDREEYHKKLTPAQLSERQRQPIPFHVIINPRIVSADNTVLEFFEGCLSVTEYSAIVPRARAVTVEYLNACAESERVEAVGWHARILQHEIDHLAGVLYVDRMRTCTMTTLENLERFWKDLPTSDVLAKLKSGLGSRGV